MAAPAPTGSSRHPWRRAALALAYLLLVLVLLLLAISEWQSAGTTDGSFLSGVVMMATLPLSYVAVLGASAFTVALGTPLSDQDAGAWMFVVFALCALVNAGVIWRLPLRGHWLRSLLGLAPPGPASPDVQVPPGHRNLPPPPVSRQ